MLAFSLANYRHITSENPSKIDTPILIISGEKDLVLGQGQKVAKKLPNGNYLEIKGANHFSLATENEAHIATVNFY